MAVDANGEEGLFTVMELHYGVVVAYSTVRTTMIFRSSIH